MAGIFATAQAQELVRESNQPRQESLAVFDLQAVAEQACKDWLQSRFGSTSANKYDPTTSYLFSITMYPGSLMQIDGLFSGHQFLNFNAAIVKSTNGLETDHEDLPLHVCVVSDQGEVLGMEASTSAGAQ